MIDDIERIADREDLKSIMMDLDIDENDPLQLCAKERTWQFCNKTMKTANYTFKDLARTAFIYYQGYYDSGLKNIEFYTKLGVPADKAKEEGRCLALELIQERQNSQNQVLAAS